MTPTHLVNVKTPTSNWVGKAETHRTITKKEFSFLGSGDNVSRHRHYPQGQDKEQMERQTA